MSEKNSYHPKEEHEKFYNLPSAAADLEHWAKFPKLRFYEMLALTFNKDPRIVHPYIMIKEKGTEFGKAYFDGGELLKRSGKWGEYDASSPGEMLENQNYGGILYSEKFQVPIKECIEIADDVDVKFPEKFTKLVMSRPIPSGERDWKAECKERDILIKEQKKDIKAINSKYKSLKEIHEGLMEIFYTIIVREPYNFAITGKDHCTSMIVKKAKKLEIVLGTTKVRTRCQEAVKFCEDSIPLEELRKKKK